MDSVLGSGSTVNSAAEAGVLCLSMHDEGVRSADGSVEAVPVLVDEVVDWNVVSTKADNDATCVDERLNVGLDDQLTH